MPSLGLASPCWNPFCDSGSEITTTIPGVSKADSSRDESKTKVKWHNGAIWEVTSLPEAKLGFHPSLLIYK